MKKIRRHPFGEKISDNVAAKSYSHKKCTALISCIIVAAMLMAIMLFGTFSASAEVEQWDGTAATEFSGGGTGTKEDPFKIATAAELKLYADKVSYNGNDFSAILTADIDLNPGYTFTFEPDTGLVKLEKTDDGVKGYFGTGVTGDASGENNYFDETASTKGAFYPSNISTETGEVPTDLNTWTPICHSQGWYYKSTFNGNDKTVSGLYINDSENYYVGLIGYAKNTALISGVTVENSFICGNKYAGGVCGEGYTNTIIKGCSSSAMVIGTKCVGGVCGYGEDATISDCSSSATVIGDEDVGGLCGNIYNSTISDCSGSATVIGGQDVGGVCGNISSYCKISNCFNTVDITGNKNVGGVCGYIYRSCTISNCFNTGNVTGNESVGGVCGYSEGLRQSNGVYSNTISGCYNTGNVSNSGSYAGGLCGRNASAIISDCFNTGNIISENLVGGLCGNDGFTQAFGTYFRDVGSTFTNCYNTGTVTATKADSSYTFAGGLCGLTDIYMKVKFTNCYNTGKVTTVVTGQNCAGGLVASISQYGEAIINGCYYLTGCAANDVADINSTAKVTGAGTEKTVEEFASGEVAWLLNTAGKNVGEEGYNHTGVWSQSADLPIFADDENKAVYKIEITGVASKTYYPKAGDSFTMPENIYSATYTETVNVSADVIYVADAEIASAQPKLGTSITMIYTAKVLTSLVGENTLQMVFTFTGKTYTEDGTAGAVDGDYTYYSFCFNRVAPQFMGDAIDASLTIGENTITKTGYSLEIYCDTMLAKSDDELEAMLQGNTSATVEELKTLLNDILLYGAASQVYKDYKTDALVGNLDNLTFEALVETDRLISGNGNKDAYFTAVGLSFDNINKIYWKISVSIVNLKNVTVNIYREGDETPIAAELTRVSNGVYIVYSEDITAREFGVKYTAEIVYDGNVAQSATYSVNSYVFSKQTAETAIRTLVKALCNYGKSTAAYVAE